MTVLPNLLQVHLQEGLERYAQGEALQALWAFFEELSVEPRNALGHYLCGLAFQTLELEQEARAEWETVLTLTGGDQMLPRDEKLNDEMPWVRSIVERLLGKGLMTPSKEMPASMPALVNFLGIGPDNSGAGISHQGELEDSILVAVHLYGNCDVKDRHISARLIFTTEEQVIDWKQSFSARKGLKYHPYQNVVGQDIRHEEVIFTRNQS